jgi:hypothetical protein
VRNRREPGSRLRQGTGGESVTTAPQTPEATEPVEIAWSKRAEAWDSNGGVPTEARAFIAADRQGFLAGFNAGRSQALEEAAQAWDEGREFTIRHYSAHVRNDEVYEGFIDQHTAISAGRQLNPYRAAAIQTGDQD